MQVTVIQNEAIIPYSSHTFGSHMPLESVYARVCSLIKIKQYAKVKIQFWAAG
jgi:hypothetical protein